MDDGDQMTATRLRRSSPMTQRGHFAGEAIIDMSAQHRAGKLWL
jgi:hypothetical protein